MKQEYFVRWLFEAKVYALTDFEDNVFYVGCTTKSLSQRLMMHKHSHKSYGSWSNSRKDEKIRSLEGKVKIVELERLGVFGIDKREAQRCASNAEERWVKKFLSQGAELVNTVYITGKTKRGSKKTA